MPTTEPLRVVIAPDSFSGTMTAPQAVGAIAVGWARSRPQDLLVRTPMSDGGLGLIDVVQHAHPDAGRHQVEVADARGLARRAEWLLLEDGTAVVESAEAIGLHHLAPEHRNPVHATTYGLGQLLTAVAVTPGVRRVLIGLGGSATVDGGLGMVSALSAHAVRRADGNAVKVGGRWVIDAVRIRQFDSPLSGLEVVVAADVDNPLLGPDGAARMFGPQKGATPEVVVELERALASWADVVEQDGRTSWRDEPGSGAAGGLGFALRALLKAELTPGASLVADLVGLDVAGADVVITGEGRLDAQTSHGKAPWLVATRGREVGATVLAVAGQTALASPHPFDDVQLLGADGLEDPVGATERAAAELARRL